MIKNKNDFKISIIKNIKKYKLLVLFIFFWFYIMYTNDRDFNFINIVLNLTFAIIFYFIADGLINQK